MALKKRVLNAYLFPSGNLAACDCNGQQIGELQGLYSIDKHRRILLEAMDDCKFEGFHILPTGFIESVKDYANYFRQRNLSWEDIQNI